MDSAIYHGTLPLLLEGPLISRGKNGELDKASWKVLVRAGLEEDDLQQLGFSVNNAITGLGAVMGVDEITETPESELVIECAITASGLLTAGERRRRVISFGQREVAVGPIEKVVLAWVTDEKGEDQETSAAVDRVKRRVPKLDGDGEQVYETILTASGSHDRWNIKEPIATVRDTYFSTTIPSTAAVGSASAPPNAPTPPAFLWGGYDEATRANHPNGWVLDDRTIEDVIGGALYRVTDLYAYYQALIPD